MIFANRKDAGMQLAEKLLEYMGEETMVLGIPRGGVIVAHELQQRLECRLGIIVTRKLGFPGNPEYGIGAVAHDGTFVISDAAARNPQVTAEYLEQEKKRQMAEIERRMRAYGASPSDDLSDTNVIVVDDGIATGMTVLVALRFLRKANPKTLVLAVPVAPRDTINKLKTEADHVICLHSPTMFFAVGQFYRDFDQISDEQVIAILQQK